LIGFVFGKSNFRYLPFGIPLTTKDLYGL